MNRTAFLADPIAKQHDTGPGHPEQPARWDAAVREHTMMIEALGARDGARMASILESHLLAKRDAALAIAAQGIAQVESLKC